jgi:hypothetical protein
LFIEVMSHVISGGDRTITRYSMANSLIECHAPAPGSVANSIRSTWPYPTSMFQYSCDSLVFQFW